MANDGDTTTQTRTRVRLFSPCGPCLTAGELVRTTPKFHVYREWHGGDRYDGERRIARAASHTTPCPRCRDHAATVYPHGLMD